MSKSNKSTSEKNTDYLFLSKWNEVFNEIYNTGTNKELFGTLKPDGWQISNNILIIIENKKDYKNIKKAKEQLLKYFNKVKTNNKLSNFKKIYLIFGFGDDEINFNYNIYKIENLKLVRTIKTLNNILQEMNLKEEFNERNIHIFNQYLYNNCDDLIKSQKTLFVASILLTLKIDPDFIKDYNPEKPGFIIANRMLELIQNQYNDETLTNQFSFLKKSLQNKYLYDLINKLSVNVKKYSKDILNKFYSEFCVWDSNNDAVNGVVLTPHDIVELMVKELNIKETDTVLDFCTGTGSFLLEAGKYSKHLIGCEYNEERYTLSRCNFILNDLEYNNIYHNNCFNQEFPKVDKTIINPPFSCKTLAENVAENTTNWKFFNEEQKFLLYQIQCLKIGGLGACIIPRGNFNNTNKLVLKFKNELMKHIQILKIINCNSHVFEPNASVECAIIIYQRIKSTDKPNISKNVKVIDYTNDGYDIRRLLRVKITEPQFIEQIRDLKFDDDWNFKKNIEPLFNSIIPEIILYNFNYITSLINLQIHNQIFDNITETKYKLSELFEIVKVKTFSIQDTPEGDIPLYGATQLNRPVKFINQYSINTDESKDPLIKKYGLFCINKTGNGGAGISFIRKGKFAVNSTVLCCKMKKEISITNAGYVSHQLHKIFNRSNSLNLTKFNETEIYVINNNDTIKNIEINEFKNAFNNVLTKFN